MTRHNQDYCWHKLSYLEGLEALLLWKIERQEEILNSAHSALASFVGKPFREVVFVRLGNMQPNDVV